MVKQIKSRGVPASETFYLPAYNSQEIRAFQDNNENPTRNLWSIEEITNFVFPKKYQEKYYEIAISFLKKIIEKKELSGKDTSAFLKENNFSKATFYNKILPRLRRIGMLKISRETIIAEQNKRKYRPMIIRLSKTFGNYLIKIGDSWLGIVDDVRSKK